MSRLSNTVPSTRTILSILVISTMIRAATALNLPSWLANILPNSGNGLLQDGIKCYGLPYGGIGFLSHALTYWTILCLSNSRSPWLLSKLHEYKFDFVLGVASVISSILLSVLAIVRCRNSWSLVLIATWKMLLSFSLGCTTIHRALDVRRVEKGPYEEMRLSRFRNKYKKVTRFPTPSIVPSLWLVFYVFGVVIGLVGLIDVVVEVWPTRTKAMEIISAVFGAAVLLTGIIGVAIGPCMCGCFGGIGITALGVIGMTGILAALYSDWMLAAIEVQGGGNWAGFPSSDITWLYWTYFAVKRLPFFSI